MAQQEQLRATDPEDLSLIPGTRGTWGVEDQTFCKLLSANFQASSMACMCIQTDVKIQAKCNKNKKIN